MNMEPHPKSDKCLPWWLPIFTVVIITIIGFLFLAVPNFVHSGPSKKAGIFYRLREIETAKEEWALEHNTTNAAQLTRALAPSDLAPYLPPEFTNNIFLAPHYGEVYFIGRLNEHAKAQLTRDLREYGAPKSSTLPKGSIIELGTNDEELYFLPGQSNPISLFELYGVRTNK